MQKKRARSERNLDDNALIQQIAAEIMPFCFAGIFIFFFLEPAAISPSYFAAENFYSALLLKETCFHYRLLFLSFGIIMAFKFNLRDKWISCLESQPERRFTAKEIAERIFVHYREDCERKRKNSEQDLNDDSRLISQISQKLKPRLIEEIRHIKIIAGLRTI